jgi:hypothetical protein
MDDPVPFPEAWAEITPCEAVTADPVDQDEGRLALTEHFVE